MESIDFGRDIDDTDEHLIIREPSLFTEGAYKFFGRAIFRVRKAKIALNSIRQAKTEVGIDVAAYESIFAPEGETQSIHADSARAVRREELYKQGVDQLTANTINYEHGSRKFIGELIARTDT